MKNQPTQTLQSNALSVLTILSLISLPFVWRVPNILPLVATGGLVSSGIYYRKVGYLPSKLEKQFIETQNNLSEQAKSLDSEAQKLEVERRNLRKEFEKWRDSELERIEQARAKAFQDGEKQVQSRLKDADEFIATRSRELETRSQALAQKEELLEQRALNLAENIKATEAESIKRVAVRDKAGLAELQQIADALEQDRKAVAAEKEQLLKDLELLERQWQQKFLEQEERHQEDYKQLELVYTNVAGEFALENHALKRPDYFDPPSNTEEYAANDVMKLLGQHNIFAKVPILKSDDRGFRLSFKVAPVRLKVKDSEIPEKSLSAGEAYKIINAQLLPELRATVPGCESQPTIKPTWQGIELYFDTTGVNWEEVETKNPNKVHELDKTIFDLFATTYHVGLEGATGRGKTTTTDNVLQAMIEELGRDALTIKVASGKPDEALRKYGCVVGNQKALLLLKEAADLVQKRLDIHIADYEANRSLTKFSDDKRLYFFDEVTDLVAWVNSGDPDVAEFLLANDFPINKNSSEKNPKPANDIVGLLLKRCWRLGRSLGIMILIAGQNLSASALGVNVPDLENMGMIYVGTGAKKGIEERGLKSEKRYLHKQYSLRISEGQQFFALFVTGSGESWLATLPQQGWIGARVQVGHEAEEDSQPRFDQPAQTSTQDGQTSQTDEELINLIKANLDKRLSQVDEVSKPGGLPQKNSGLMPWKAEADPRQLTESARSQIEDLIRQGKRKPHEIAIAIWGDVVNVRAKPYNGKTGVKFWIETIIKEAEK